MTTQSRADVGVLGSINLDTVVTCHRLPAPGETVAGASLDTFAGGKGLNQAVAAARSGARVSFFGAVGSDPAADELRALMEAEAIDTSGLATVDGPSGRAIVLVESTGENSIVVIPGANAAVTSVDQPPAVLLAQMEVPAQVVHDSFVAAGGQTTKVLNPAPAADVSDRLIALCDVLIPNEHEAAALGGPERLLSLGCPVVIVTRGGAGVDVVTPQGTMHVPPIRVDPVDTTGAGDAFCGSFAARLSAGSSIGEAVRWATVAGGLATTVKGAVPSQPHQHQIEQMLSAS